MMELQSLESALLIANTFYGLEGDPNILIELALFAWGRIGNKYTRLYKFVGDIRCPDYTVELPCNVDIIEAVTYDGEDWNIVTNLHINGDYASLFIESYIEGRKTNKDLLYTSGRYAKYTLIGNILHFEKDYGRVHVLYKGVYVDENGLPLINEKELEAIATFLIYILKLKEGIMTNNPTLILLSLALKLDWQRLCDSARIPMYFDLNDMNKILDSKVSWNRKLFGKSFKPVR